jgi:hypothetical protein
LLARDVRRQRDETAFVKVNSKSQRISLTLLIGAAGRRGALSEWERGEPASFPVAVISISAVFGQH